MADQSNSGHSERVQKSQQRYKRNFNKGLLKNSEVIKDGDNVFLPIERKGKKGTRQKRAPIAEGPFPVFPVKGKAKTVVIKRSDKSVEKFSRSRVALAPKTENDERGE